MMHTMAQWRGPTLVIGVAEDLPMAELVRLPVHQHQRTVLIMPGAPTEDLAGLLNTYLPPDVTSIRLASSHAATTGLAQHVADVLDIEVISADGTVLLVGPGAMFVANPEGEGSWLTHRRGAAPTSAGPRYPVPLWHIDLPKRSRMRRRGLVARDLPAGFWLYRADSRAVAVDDPAFAVSALTDQVTVLIGRPGMRPPAEQAVYAWLAALPAQTRGRLRLVPYGRCGPMLDAVAERLSEQFGVTVERTAGIPAEGFYITEHHTRPVVQTMAYDGSATPRITSWISPTTGRIESGQTTADVGGGYTLEVVRCGLRLSDADVAGDPVVHGQAADPDIDLLLIDAVDIERAQALAEGLIRRLPRDTAARLRTLTRVRMLSGGPVDVVPAEPLTPHPPLAPIALPASRPLPPSPASPRPPFVAPAREEPAPTLPMLTRHDESLAVSWERCHSGDRRKVREELGRQYDIYARTVTQLLVKLPGIRPGPKEPMDDLVTDLVAVGAALSTTHPLSARSLRVLEPCIASGLARLPTFMGPVVTAGPAEASRWRGDDVLSTPGLLRANGSPPTQDDSVMLAIYSFTGRRPGILSDYDEVLFAPGAAFVVLSTIVDPRGVRWLFLREVTAGDSGPSDDFVLDKLRRALEGSQ
jgi:hypothetical protein